LRLRPTWECHWLPALLIEWSRSVTARRWRVERQTLDPACSDDQPVIQVEIIADRQSALMLLATRWPDRRRGRSIHQSALLPMTSIGCAS
jgi:hypothetical protein